ncbi:hypothetical protein CRUP_036044 [Coryphaenoides rupestris]|nr:hypothetical protein CRUP_036044 [Coryphaenoides rupestris]
MSPASPLLSLFPLGTVSLDSGLRAPPSSMQRTSWASASSPSHSFSHMLSQEHRSYVAMVIAACVLNFQRAVWLLALTLAVVVFLAWDRVMERHGDLVQRKISPITELWDSHWLWIRWVVYAALLVTLVCWVLLDTAKQGTRQLWSSSSSSSSTYRVLCCDAMTSAVPRKVEVTEECFKQHSRKLIQALLLVCGSGYVAMVIAACVLNFQRAVWLLALTWRWLCSWPGTASWNATETCAEEDLSHHRAVDSHWLWIRVVYAALLGDPGVLGAADTAKQGTRQLVSLAAYKSPSSDTMSSYVAMVIAACVLNFQRAVWLLALTLAVVVFLAWDRVMERHGDLVQRKISPVTELWDSHWLWIRWVVYAALLVTLVCWVLLDTAKQGTRQLVESILLVRPYLPQLTRSEIHAVLTGGFASTSGVILGVYISLGVDASHLMAASVMSMPASLAISKLFWPETETPSDPGEVKASRGVIAFISILAFLDGSLSWLGGLFDYPQLSFMLICSYAFAPLAFMMGVSWEDSFLVGELIGIKTFFNELLGYERMSELSRMREAGEPEYVDDVKQYISVSPLHILVPERMADFVDCGLRALIAGSMACFMTACIAGVLYVPDLRCESVLGTLLANSSVGTVGNAGGPTILECCGQLYSSVTANMSAPLNTTAAALQRCCAAAPSTFFNCSACDGQHVRSAEHDGGGPATLLCCGSLDVLQLQRRTFQLNVHRSAPLWCTKNQQQE